MIRDLFRFKSLTVTVQYMHAGFLKDTVSTFSDTSLTTRMQPASGAARQLD